MFNIDRFPVIIFSGPRTGSHALTYHLKKQYPDLKVFLEPGNVHNMKEFWDYSKSNKDFIAKIISYHFFDHPKFVQDYLISKDNYKIKLKRREMIRQIASEYIAFTRKIWYYETSQDEIKKFPIKIDANMIDVCTKEILDANHLLADIPCDQEVFYEDIKFETVVIPTPLPSNYEDLLAVIKERLG